jgi:geranylgeranyl pyrophosphate synthase
MDTSPFDLIKEDLESVEARMQEFPLPPPDSITKTLASLLAAGGKRIRPALSLLFGRMLNVPQEPLRDFAASLETIHTATLVHDDFVDNSPVRRGIPAAHSQWPPRTAVLIGDFLFAHAARLIAATGSLPVMQRFAGALTAIVDGEIRQMSGAGAAQDLKEYEQKIRGKTASLFEISCTGPALLAEDSPAAEQASAYGESFGMAFQILNDIQDFAGEDGHNGKQAGQDLRQGLVTLPALIFFDMHPEDSDVAEYRAGKREPAFLERLIERIRMSEAIERSRKHAAEYIHRAVAALSAFPPGAYRSGLEVMAYGLLAGN